MRFNRSRIAHQQGPAEAAHARIERGEKKYNIQKCDLIGVVRETADTYRPHLDTNETIIAGKFWDATAATEPEVSIEENMRGLNGLDVGSQITFDIQGRKITARVTSVRRIEWRNSGSNTEISRTPNLTPVPGAAYSPFSLTAAVPAGVKLVVEQPDGGSTYDAPRFGVPGGVGDPVGAISTVMRGIISVVPPAAEPVSAPELPVPGGVESSGCIESCMSLGPEPACWPARISTATSFPSTSLKLARTSWPSWRSLCCASWPSIFTLVCGTSWSVLASPCAVWISTDFFETFVTRPRTI